MKINKTMMTDLYEITMAQTYFDDKAFDKIVYLMLSLGQCLLIVDTRLCLVWII